MGFDRSSIRDIIGIFWCRAPTCTHPTPTAGGEVHPPILGKRYRCRRRRTCSQTITRCTCPAHHLSPQVDFAPSVLRHVVPVAVSLGKGVPRLAIPLADREAASDVEDVSDSSQNKEKGRCAPYYPDNENKV